MAGNSDKKRDRNHKIIQRFFRKGGTHLLPGIVIQSGITALIAKGYAAPDYAFLAFFLAPFLTAGICRIWKKEKKTVPESGEVPVDMVRGWSSASAAR